MKLQFETGETLVPSHETNSLKAWREYPPTAKEYDEAMQIVTFKKEKRKGNGDSKSAVTVLSRAVVTSWISHNQIFSYKYVTGDNKFSLFNSLVMC